MFEHLQALHGRSVLTLGSGNSLSLALFGMYKGENIRKLLAGDPAMSAVLEQARLKTFYIKDDDRMIRIGTLDKSHAVRAVNEHLYLNEDFDHEVASQGNGFLEELRELQECGKPIKFPPAILHTTAESRAVALKASIEGNGIGSKYLVFDRKCVTKLYHDDHAYLDNDLVSGNLVLTMGMMMGMMVMLVRVDGTEVHLKGYAIHSGALSDVT